ncbi:MAG: hypothetical protein CL916_12800, partial [Deltaproteobacteria bacterium]|nr:hypothetical protein [Deltaproteobacteria bacterium]
MDVLHCKSCDTPCDPLSHFCSWCGTPLAQIKVPHNLDQQGHVDFCYPTDEDTSTQVGQIRLYISDDFIQNSKTESDYSTFYCEIHNTGVANLVVFISDADLNRQHNWALGLSLNNPEISIPPNETGTIPVKIQVSSLRHALQRLDLSNMEDDLQWEIPLVLSRCLLTENGRLRNQAMKIVLRPNLPVYIQPNMSIYRYIPLELVYNGQFAHHIQITNPSAQPVTIKRVEFKDYPTNPQKLLGMTFDMGQNLTKDWGSLQRVSYATLIDRNLGNRMALNTVIEPSDSKDIELLFD